MNSLHFAEAKIRAEIYHLKAAGPDNWHKMDEVISLIEEAAEMGTSHGGYVYVSVGGTGVVVYPALGA